MIRSFQRTAVLISLTLGAVAVAADRPSVISGRVSGEGKPLAGVLISDGCRVVRTNDQGAYQLAIGPDSGQFVFMTTPRGWWSESFYTRVDEAAETGQANFHLDPIDQPNRFDFVFTCDLSSPKAWAIPKLKASIHEINQLQPTPAFTLVQGDLWLHGTDWLRMHESHMHENERITVGGVEYVESISMCGTWWKNPDVKGFERGVDGCPRGYRIVSVNGTSVTHRYRSTCESYVDRRGEFIGLKERVAVGGKIDFVFNCYDAPNGSIAEARLDTQDWQAMTTINYGSTTITKPHHFRLVSSTDGLQPGLHVVEVRVTWPDATVVLERRSIKLVQ